MDDRTDDSLIATGFLRSRTARAVPREGQPGAPLRLPRRDDRHDWHAACSGLTVNCARCHNHKFDPIAQKDYYALEAALFGYVETEVPLAASRAEAEAYLAKNEEIDAKIEALRDRRSSAIEKPYRDKLRASSSQEGISGESCSAPCPSPKRSGRRASSCSPRRC